MADGCCLWNRCVVGVERRFLCVSVCRRWVYLHSTSWEKQQRVNSHVNNISSHRQTILRIMIRVCNWKTPLKEDLLLITFGSCVLKLKCCHRGFFLTSISFTYNLPLSCNMSKHKQLTGFIWVLKELVWLLGVKWSNRNVSTKINCNQDWNWSQDKHSWLTFKVLVPEIKGFHYLSHIMVMSPLLNTSYKFIKGCIHKLLVHTVTLFGNVQ